jgi:hypothetical protein
VEEDKRWSGAGAFVGNVKPFNLDGLRHQLLASESADFLVRCQVMTLAHFVRLFNPASEIVVELIACSDSELVNEQLLRVWRRSPNTWISDLPLKVQIPVQPVLLGLRPCKSASCSLECDGGFGNRDVERTTRPY